MDLYVTSGGYEIPENNPLLQDRLYVNDGKGGFEKSNALPKMYSNTKVIWTFLLGVALRMGSIQCLTHLTC
jgi:hypothetical protein